MKPVRKRFEGVINLVRFNWHYYLILFLALILIFFAGLFVVKYRIFATIFIVATLLFCIFSIVATYYIYDLSPLYKFTWFKDQLYYRPARIVNIHGGYDETSKLIAELYPKDEVSVFDFYNPEKNAEISTKRARKTNPPFAGTRNITIDHIPLKDGYADRIFLILSTHEIRSNKERNIFFEELNRVLSRNGKIIVVEHLRDAPNFLAYNIGFLHFYQKQTWLNNFFSSGLHCRQQIKITPFITAFILDKNGIPT